MEKMKSYKDDYADRMLKEKGFTDGQIHSIRWSFLCDLLDKEQAYLKSINLNQYEWIGEELRKDAKDVDWHKVEVCASDIRYIARDMLEYRRMKAAVEAESGGKQP